jgi:GAF domain-containing protein
MNRTREAKVREGSTYPVALKPLLKEVLKKIQHDSGCQSVAIRLDDRDDFPYYVQIGFPEFFIAKEDSLNVKNVQGKRILDSNGMPFVECMCGNVLRGRFNPESSFFTKSGAFWTNSTTQLLSSLTEKEKQEVGKTRNTCHDFGYESVALVPIHTGGKTIGLVQVNDPSENKFTPRKIERYQVLADRIGAMVSGVVEFYSEADS